MKNYKLSYDKPKIKSKKIHKKKLQYARPEINNTCYCVNCSNCQKAKENVNGTKIKQ